MAAGTEGGKDTRAVVAQALDDYRSRFGEERWQHYLAIHHERYHLLVTDCLRLIEKAPMGADGRKRMLVIGPRFEVDLVHRLAPDVLVDTMGLNPGLFELRADERYVPFDLNKTDDEPSRPDIGGYGLIVMAEVIEHLWTAPSVILRWLRSVLLPTGFLYVQTPNAAALPKRLRLLMGINPYQELQTDRAYPGHIREMTVKEVAREGRAVGLEVAELRTANYFDSEKQTNRAYERLERFVPKTMRAGITAVFRRPSS